MSSPDSAAVKCPLRAAYLFRLYLVGGAPSSVRAIANLYAICHKYFPDSYRIEMIDVMQDPLRGLTDGIYVTPAVIKVSPPPEQRIIGDLSEEENVLCALGLPERRAHE